MIKYGISLDYLPDWGIQEALREIYQNFEDFGDFDKEINELAGGQKQLILKNNYEPDSLEFLKVGCSDKRNNSNTIGEHGEGLKMALMVLKREKCPVQVETKELILIPNTYEDPDLGECFGIEKVECSSVKKKFSVTCYVPKEELMAYEDKQLKEENILHSCHYGQMLKDMPGKVYVGGIYVTIVEDLKHGYNFRPEDIKLDRDRSVPKSFDIDYYAARIFESYKDIKEEDLNTRDCKYVNQIPKKLEKKFKPKLTAKGAVIFQTKKGTVANENIANTLIKKPENQKKIQKLKYNMTKKRVPHSILQEFYDKHSQYWQIAARIDCKNLIERAKGWQTDK